MQSHPASGSKFTHDPATPHGTNRWRVTLLDGEAPVADVSVTHSENSGAFTIAGQLNDRGVKSYIAHTR